MTDDLPPPHSTPAPQTGVSGSADLSLSRPRFLLLGRAASLLRPRSGHGDKPWLGLGWGAWPLSRKHKAPFVVPGHESGQGATWDRRRWWEEQAGVPEPPPAGGLPGSRAVSPLFPGPENKVPGRPHPISSFLSPTPQSAPPHLPWNGEAGREEPLTPETWGRGVGRMNISRLWVCGQGQGRMRKCVLLSLSSPPNPPPGMRGQTGGRSGPQPQERGWGAARGLGSSTPFGRNAEAWGWIGWPQSYRHSSSLRRTNGHVGTFS